MWNPKRIVGGDTKFAPPLDSLCRARVAVLAARRAKNITETAFKPITPMKMSSGLGDFYGTIGGKVPYIEQGSFMHQKKKGDFHSMPPNILTNPIKKASRGALPSILAILSFTPFSHSLPII